MNILNQTQKQLRSNKSRKNITGTKKDKVQPNNDIKT